MQDKIYFTVDNVSIPVNVSDMLESNFRFHYSNYYNRSKSSILNYLCDKYGSDKGEISSEGHPYPWPSHSYADFVERIFSHCRLSVKNVFECGMGTNNPVLASNMTSNGRPGASLRVWKEYFPNANIFGADIDKNILFSEDRIKTFFCDQTNINSIFDMWKNMEGIEFDFMIDDGLHTFEAGVCLFDGSFHKLKDGGIYIIEDIKSADIVKFLSYFSDRKFDFELVNLYRKNFTLGDNSLIVIRKL